MEAVEEGKRLMEDFGAYLEGVSTRMYQAWREVSTQMRSLWELGPVHTEHVSSFSRSRSPVFDASIPAMAAQISFYEVKYVQERHDP